MLDYRKIREISGVPSSIIEGHYGIIPKALEEMHYEDFGLDLEVNTGNFLSIAKAGKEKMDEFILEINKMNFLDTIQKVAINEREKEKDFINNLLINKKDIIKEETLLKLQTLNNGPIEGFPELFNEVQKIIDEIYIASKSIEDQSATQKLIEISKDISEKRIFEIMSDFFIGDQFNGSNILDINFNDIIGDGGKLKEYMIKKLSDNSSDAEVIKSVEDYVNKVYSVANGQEYNYLRIKGDASRTIREILMDKSLIRKRKMKVYDESKGKIVEKRMDTHIVTIRSFITTLITGYLNGKFRGMTSEGALDIRGLSNTGKVIDDRNLSIETDNIIHLTSDFEYDTSFADKINQHQIKTQKQLNKAISELKNGFVIRYSSKDQRGGKIEYYLGKADYSPGTGGVTAKHEGSILARMHTFEQLKQLAGKEDKNMDVFLFVFTNYCKDLLFSGNNAVGKILLDVLVQFGYNFLMEEWDLDTLIGDIEKIQEEVQEEVEYLTEGGAKTLHVFYLNGNFYPSSFILTTIFEYFNQLELSKSARTINLKPISATITLGESAYTEYTKIRKTMPPGTGRWNVIRDFAQKNVNFSYNINISNLEKIIDSLQKATQKIMI